MSGVKEESKSVVIVGGGLVCIHSYTLLFIRPLKLLKLTT